MNGRGQQPTLSKDQQDFLKILATFLIGGVIFNLNQIAGIIIILFGFIITIVYVRRISSQPR